MVYSNNESSLRAIALAEEHPLDFSIQYPPRREYFKDHFRGNLDDVDLTTQQDLLLYLHIPFCHQKCYFCNFAVDVRKSPELHASYINTLIQQLNANERLVGDDTVIRGIDIGGGTPTLIETKQLVRLLRALELWVAKSNIPNPLSIETTPRIAGEDFEKMQALADNGVTRISMGVQSTNTEFLEQVNRGEQVHMAEKAFENLQRAGFSRINADIIFGLPNQTEDDWKRDLDFIISSGIDSVTTYDCLYRGKGRALTKKTNEFPSQEVYGALYDIAYSKLTEAGFHAPYGSVNFSRHAEETGTSPYFEGRLLDHIPYIGLGNYSSSQIGNKWWFAPHGVDQWQNAVGQGNALPFQDAYSLPAAEIIAKQILLSFNYGFVDPQRIEKRFGINFESFFGAQVNLGFEKGYIRERDGLIQVAPGQFKNMPQIRSLFYSPQAIDWIIEQQKRPQVQFNSSFGAPESADKYKHGLVIGKFMPPHTGHDYLLNTSSLKAENLTVLMMARRNDRVPGDLRLNWIKAVHPEKDIRLIQHDLPTDYSDSNVWDMWIETIRKALGETNIDVVFSSEQYGAELARRLNVESVTIDQPRSHVPISATMIRDDPRQYSNFLSSAGAKEWMLNEFN